VRKHALLYFSDLFRAMELTTMGLTAMKLRAMKLRAMKLTAMKLRAMGQALRLKWSKKQPQIPTLFCRNILSARLTLSLVAQA